MPAPTQNTIFLTGATGYIGGRLAPRLLDRGYRVRCLARSADKLRTRLWAQDEKVEIVEGGAGDVELVSEAMRGCIGAYYLIHSMDASTDDYKRKDLELAEAFAEAAKKADLPRIIYLGGMGNDDENLSKHLESRREVEKALASTGIPVTVLRAAMIIGSGSASFEILRYLVERLPIMITPKWVSTEAQPIAVRDVMHYLISTIETPETAGRVYDIGGADVSTYQEIMRTMADALELPRRYVIPVPVMTPKLSSLWIHLVTPMHASIARPLAEGLRNRVVCRNDDARRDMPHPDGTSPLGVREAIDAALVRLKEGEIETTWSDAGPMPGDPDWAGGTLFVDEREMVARADLGEVWETLETLGGDTGYFANNWLWQLRGFLDRLVGGPGLRRGRRHAQELRLGDALDFWRVTAIDEPDLLELTAEMWVPGAAWLSFELEPTDHSSHPDTRITMIARFKPRGLLGLLYWYGVLPLHGIVFKGMLRGIVQRAEARAKRDTTNPRPHP